MILPPFRIRSPPLSLQTEGTATFCESCNLLSVWIIPPNHVSDSSGLSITIAEERKRGDMVRYLIRQAVRKRNHRVANQEEINKIHEGAQIVKD